MNLEQFITESITQICNAINESNTKLKDSSAIVNPRHVVTSKDDSSLYGYAVWEGDTKYDRLRAHVHKIDFDIAVHVSEVTSKKGGGGLEVGIARIGGGKSRDETSQSESRIKFTIPIIFPFGYFKDPDHKN
jgi:hypothetical protein